MRATLYNTELDDRILWFDGTTSMRAGDILKTNLPFRFVDQETDEIRAYNKYVSSNDALKVKDRCDPLSFVWNIPASYKTLNVESFLTDKLIASTSGVSDSEFNKRSKRLVDELKLYKTLQLYDVLRALIYIINTLTINDAVWGIGRGSSVSSYVLYLIGTHDVDSFAYGLDISEFLHN
jgi:DNA polymerase III alpha subunit